MASTILQKFPKNTEVKSEPVNITDALGRFRRPLDNTRVTLSVMGVYCLPEAWKAKVVSIISYQALQLIQIVQDDPVELAAYTYEIDIAGIKMKNSKVCARQLTEEEKAELAAAAAAPKGKGAPPKGKGVKEEEPSKEELERLESERKAKEEREAKLKAEWDSLDENERFWRTNEDPYKEPSIKMVTGRPPQPTGRGSDLSLAEQKEDAEAAQVGVSVCDKNGFELIEFEEFVREDGGVWLTFSKLPVSDPVVVDDPKAKKAPPPKGKAATEDLKPTFGKAWVDLSDLKKPGAKYTCQRVFINTVPPATKEVVDGKDVFTDQTDHDSLFETAKTYVHFKIELSEPVTPLVPTQPEPKPREIVPVKTFIRWPYSKIATDDFCK